MAPYFGRGVAEVGVDEHAGNDTVSIEGLTVYGVGYREACVGGGVVPVSISIEEIEISVKGADVTILRG